MGYLLGLGLGTLLVLSIAIPRHLLWCRRMDRHEAVMIKLRDEERDARLRGEGWDDEDIALFHSKVGALRKEYGCE